MKLMAGVLVALFLSASCALDADSPSPHTVTVFGAADTLLAPDVAKIEIRLSDKDKKLAIAKANSDENLQKVVALAAKFGLPREDMQIGRVRLGREYETDQRSQARIFTAFSLDRQITLRLRDLTRLEELLDALLKGESLEFSYDYESSAADIAINELRLRAVRAARDKAEGLAKEAGGRLGRVVEISEFPPGDEGIHRSYVAMRIVPDVAPKASPESLQVKAMYFVVFALE